MAATIIILTEYDSRRALSINDCHLNNSKITLSLSLSLSLNFSNEHANSYLIVSIDWHLICGPKANEINPLHATHDDISDEGNVT